MITIVTWAWRGERDYVPAHVAGLAAGLRRHMTAPYRLVLFTDDPPDGVPDDVEVRWIPAAAHEVAEVRTLEKRTYPSSYRRLWLFSAAAQELGDRVLLVDIDVVVVNDLMPLVDYAPEASFVAWRPALHWGLQRRIGGGIWLLRTGSELNVWEDFVFDPAIAQAKAKAAGFRGSDQAWLSYHLGHRCEYWGPDSGIYSVRDFTRDTRQNRRRPISALPDDARIVQFNGHDKPWHAVTWKRHRWLVDHWLLDPPPGVAA